MAIDTILFITLALILALGFSFFQYLYKRPEKKRKDYLLFILRFLSVFIVLLLLINPKITRNQYTIEKPDLYILADNSQSLKYLNSGDALRGVGNLISTDDDLQERFNITLLSFGKGILSDDSLTFSSSGSDLHQSLADVSELSRNKHSAILFLSDANQTSGRDFRYFKKSGNEQIFPVIIGDTTQYSDLAISRINSNRYAFLNNNFPVEAFVKYSGDKNESSVFEILQNGKVLFSEKLNFDSENRAKVISANIPVKSLGIKTYQVRVKVLKDEKNTLNNEQNFAVQVIDERTKVLLLSSIDHPDLGAIKKAIESNQQRSVDIKIGGIENIQINDYQLIIIYQLNNEIKDYLDKILDKKLNCFLITGTETDWNYINSKNLGLNKKSPGPAQDIFPVYNDQFGTFQFENIGFDNFPPLSDKFGKVTFDPGLFDVMLYQQMQGVKTQEPLLAISSSSPKFGFLLGDGIWRWRANSYLDTKSFGAFDDFFNKIMQNLASSKKRQRLRLDYKNFYYGNEEIVIDAQYYDQNYQLDLNGKLQIHLKDSLQKTEITSDFMVRDNFYEFNAGDLPPGNYQFTVTNKDSGINASGQFEVIAYDMEQQFTSANLSAMKTFAQNNDTRVFYPDQIDSLKSTLLNSTSLKPLRKSEQKSVSLIDWYYLLFLLIFVLAVEWFYRKYLGLI